MFIAKKYAYLDHKRQEELLTASNIDYTIVIPTGLTNFNKSLEVKESENNIPKPNLLISRKAAAIFMVDSLEDSSRNHKTITVSDG